MQIIHTYKPLFGSESKLVLECFDAILVVFIRVFGSKRVFGASRKRRGYSEAKKKMIGLHEYPESQFED